MVWGSISANGVGDLVFINGNMDASSYKQILIHHLTKKYSGLLDGSLFFQQDNDPKHKSREVQNYLSNKKIQLLDWPANSPDLNPIENCWATLKKEVSEIGPNNILQLKEAINKS